MRFSFFTSLALTAQFAELCTAAVSLKQSDFSDMDDNSLLLAQIDNYSTYVDELMRGATMEQQRLAELSVSSESQSSADSESEDCGCGKAQIDSDSNSDLDSDSGSQSEDCGCGKAQIDSDSESDAEDCGCGQAQIDSAAGLAKETNTSK